MVEDIVTGIEAVGTDAQTIGAAVVVSVSLVLFTITVIRRVLKK